MYWKENLTDVNILIFSRCGFFVSGILWQLFGRGREKHQWRKHRVRYNLNDKVQGILPERTTGMDDLLLQPFILMICDYYTHQKIGLTTVNARSHWAKAKEKIFTDVCRLLFHSFACSLIFFAFAWCEWKLMLLGKELKFNLIIIWSSTVWWLWT